MYDLVMVHGVYGRADSATTTGGSAVVLVLRSGIGTCSDLTVAVRSPVGGIALPCCGVRTHSVLARTRYEKVQ